MRTTHPSEREAYEWRSETIYLVSVVSLFFVFSPCKEVNQLSSFMYETDLYG